MTTSIRIAIVAFVLFLGAGVAVTFAPASPEGATCGNWLAPEWTKEEAQNIVDSASDTADDLSGLGADDMAGDTAGIAYAAARSYRVCTDALSTRRTLTLVALGLAVVVPGAVLFVSAGQRRGSVSPH